MSIGGTDAALASSRSTHTLLSALTNGRPFLAFEALLDLTGEFRQNDRNRSVRFPLLLKDTVIEMTMSGRTEEAQLLWNLCDSVSSSSPDTSILMVLLMCARDIRKKCRSLPNSFFNLHVPLSNCPEPTVEDTRLSREQMNSELDEIPDAFHEPHNVVDMHRADHNGSLTLRPLSSKDRYDCIADAARFTLEQRSLWVHKQLTPLRSTTFGKNPLSDLHHSTKTMLDFVRNDHQNFCRVLKSLLNLNTPLRSETPVSPRDAELSHLVLSHCISCPEDEDMPVSSPGVEARPLLVRTYLRHIEDVHPDTRRAHIHRRTCIRRRQQAMRFGVVHPDLPSDFVTGLMARASRCGAVYCDIVSFMECYSSGTRHRILRAVANFCFKVAHKYFQMLFTVIGNKSILTSNKPYAVVQAAESFISDGAILANVLEHVEDTDGSSVAILNLLMIEATEHSSNEMVQLLFYTAISAYFSIVWDWFFEGSVRRDTHTDFFGTTLGLSPGASELLQNARTFDASSQNKAGLYPDLFSKEDAQFLLRAGRSRRLLCSFGLHSGILAHRPDDVDFGNNAVCFDDVEGALHDLADGITSAHANCNIFFCGNSIAEMPGSKSAMNSQAPLHCDISKSLVNKGEPRGTITNCKASSRNGLESKVSNSDVRTYIKGETGFAIELRDQISQKHGPRPKVSDLNLEADLNEGNCVSASQPCKSSLRELLSNPVENMKRSSATAEDACEFLPENVTCVHKGGGPDVDRPMLSPTCVRCTAFQIPQICSSDPCTSSLDGVNLFTMVAHESLPDAEDILRKVMPGTRQKARFPLPLSLATQILVPLRRIDDIVQKVVLHHFVSHLRLFDHLRTLRAHVLLGAGDFANELVVQLDTASLVADANERFIHRRATGPILYGNSNTGERYARNQTQLNYCLRTALNLYSTEPNPMSELIHLDSHSSSTERSDDDRRISAGQSQFWQDRIVVRYDVAHPLNVVITEEAMEKYSRIFELFLRILRARKSLRSLFLASRRTRAWGMALRKDREFAKKIWMFRWHAEHFVSIFGGFEMEQVLRSCWTVFENGWSTAKSIWELRDSHNSFLDGCVRRCLLGEKHRSVLKVMTGGFEIVVNVDMEITKLGLADAVSGSTEVNNVTDLLVSATASLKRRCAFLTDVLERLLEGGTLPHLEHLLTQLNYNYYFQKASPATSTNISSRQQALSQASQLWQTGRISGEAEPA